LNAASLVSTSPTKQGIPLAYISSKSLTLSNTTLSFRPHYVVVSTDFNINLDPALAA
jgi:hypothetical protein